VQMKPGDRHLDIGCGWATGWWRCRRAPWRRPRSASRAARTPMR
jgi:hypothetical protein